VAGSGKLTRRKKRLSKRKERYKKRMNTAYRLVWLEDGAEQSVGLNGLSEKAAKGFAKGLLSVGMENVALTAVTENPIDVGTPNNGEAIDAVDPKPLA
jgi:hypothetical protein